MHDIQKLLINLGLSTKGSFEVYHTSVRDRPGIFALRCKQCGVIIPSFIEHINDDYYQSMDGLSYWGNKTIAEIIEDQMEDTKRSGHDLAEYIRGKSWLDIGCGIGSQLRYSHGLAQECAGVELQEKPRQIAREHGYTVYSDIDKVPDNHYDVITLYHVFEHLKYPLGMLKKIQKKVKVKGHIIIEVPHARDFLLQESITFRSFSLWSEHLILHTRESLEVMAKAAGIRSYLINGVQRYPLSNHLYWLSKGLPGGHKKWTEFNDPEMNKQYLEGLLKRDATDTLVAILKV